MKIKLLLTIAFASLHILADAQTYFPFPNSATNAIWSVEHGYWGLGGKIPNGTTFYGIKGDTIIKGNSYVKIYQCGFPWTKDTSFNPTKATYYCGIREKNKQIFVRFSSDTDKIYFDFNLALADSFHFSSPSSKFWHRVTSVDSKLLNGSYRRTLTFDFTETWIEGIGSDAGLFETNLIIGNIYTMLLCYSENENILYSPLGVCNRFIGTGINDHNKNVSVILYPNPISNELNITNSNNSPSEIIIYDITLRNIFRQKFTNSVSLNTAQLEKGIYVYEVKSQNGTSSKGKIIKQ